MARTKPLWSVGRRVLSRVIATVALGVVFLIAVIAGAFLHANIPATQRTLLREINGVLDHAIAGKIVIDKFERLGFGTVRGAEVRIYHPSGRRVILGHGVDGRIDLIALLRSLRGSGPLVVRLRRASVDHVDITFDRAPNGELLIAQTFAPEKPKPNAPPGRGVDFSVLRADVQDAHAVASLDGRNLDGTVRAVRGDVRIRRNNTQVNVARAVARVRRIVRDADATAEVKGSVRIAESRGPAIDTNLKGRLGDVPVTAQAALHDGKVDATVHVARTPPEAIVALWPSAPFTRPVAADVVVSGDEAKLDYRLRAELGDAKLVAAGAARPVLRRIDAAFSVRNFDPQALAASAPAAAINADGRADADLSEPNAPSVTASVAVQPFVVEGVRVPRADVDAALRSGNIDGHAVLNEPGARTDVTVEAHGSPELSRMNVIRFKADTNVPNLNGVKRVGPIAAGAARIHATGLIDVEHKSIDARVDARLTQVSRPEVQAQSATVTGRVKGSLDDPRIETKISANNVTTQGFVFDKLNGEAKGTLSNLDVSARGEGAEDRIALTTRLDVKHGLRMLGTHADVMQRGVQAKVDAGAIELKRGALSFRDIRVEGPANVEFSGAWGPGEKHIVIRSNQVDLEALGRALDVPLKLAGRVAMDTDLRRTARGWAGYVRANGTELRIGSVQGLAARVNALLKDDRIDGQMVVDAPSNSSARVSVRDLPLPRHFTPDELIDETLGQIQVEGRADLALLESLMPGAHPAVDIDGRAIVFARAERKERGRLPDLDAYVVTENLKVRPKRTPQTGSEFELQKALLEAASEALDFQFRGRLDGSSHREVRIDTRLADTHGPMAGATLVAMLPPSAVSFRALSEPATLLETNIDARVTVPERQVEELPTAIRPAGVQGKIEVAAEARGKLSDPEVNAHGTLRNLRVGHVELGEPLEIQFATLYDDPIADFRVRAIYQGAPVLDAEATLETSVRDWVAPQGASKPAWDASGRAALHGFPLESVSWLSDFRVAGLVKGNVSLDHLNKDPKLEGDLAIDQLRVGEVRYETTKATIRATDGHLSAGLDCRQKDGMLTARLDSGFEWRRPFAPALDDKSGVDLEAHATHFDIGAVQPFVATTFSRIGGKLYGDVNYRVHDGKTLPTGAVFLRDGVVQVPAIGQEFQDVQFDASLDEKGGLRVKDASARGLSGRVTAEAQAKFDGLSLEEAKADVVIRKHQEIPITVQGVSLGRAWGRVLVKAAPNAQKDRMVINIDVPRLHVELPKNIGREIQSLGKAPDIQIGVHQASGLFQQLTVQPLENNGGGSPTRFLVDVKLGNDVWIRRPNLFQVKLEGGPRVLVNGQTTILGQIFLKEGSVDVLGKKFSIVDGTVTFREDQPDNPIVVATARWDSPEGYSVFADFTGPVESGNLELRSNPSLTESEILSLLVFGSPEGQVGSGQQSGGLASGAAGVGGGVATMGLNRALSQLSEREITTRIDTSAAGGPRPEVAMQVTRRLAVELAYNPAPSMLTREPDHALLTLMFRLKPKWMLETTVGDAGTSVVDLIWRYRY